MSARTGVALAVEASPAKATSGRTLRYAQVNAEAEANTAGDANGDDFWLSPDDVSRSTATPQRRPSARSGEDAVPALAPQVKVPVRLELKSEVATANDRIYVGELAHCISEDPGAAEDVCAEAYGIDLGPAPEPGRQTIVQRDFIAAELAREWPQAAVQVAGAPQVKVSASADELTSDQVSAALDQLFQNSFAAHEEQSLRARVEQVRVPAHERVRSGGCSLEFPELSDLGSKTRDWLSRHLAGRQHLVARCIRAEQAGDSSSAGRDLHISADIAVERRLPLARRDIARGERLQEGDLEEGWHALERGRDGYLMHAQDGAGRLVARPIAAGQPIPLAHLVAVKAVKRGQLVHLTVKRGALSIAGQVKALKDGAIGDTIEAWYPATKKKIGARVTGEGTVERVDFE